jgi:hypothetical protein
MRKWIWGGTALVVFAAVGVYLAANYAATHPDSWLGRSANLAQFVSQRCSPLLAIGRAPATQAKVIQPAADNPEDAGQVVDGMPQAVEQPEVIVVGEPAGRFNDNLEPVPEADKSVPPPPRCPEIDHLTPDFMPYADDDREPPQADCCKDCCSGWFFAWFSGRTGCAKGGECAKSCGIVQFCLDQLADCLRSLQGLNGEAQEGFDGASGEEGQEMTDAFDQYGLPRCQEDPYHQHHYPSCPYTGRCPYPYGASYPQSPRPDYNRVAPRGQSPERQGRKPKKAASVSDLQPTLEQPKPRQTLDTLECRPGDGPRSYKYESPF